jgi:hypothetical protein
MFRHYLFLPLNAETGCSLPSKRRAGNPLFFEIPATTVRPKLSYFGFLVSSPSAGDVISLAFRCRGKLSDCQKMFRRTAPIVLRASSLRLHRDGLILGGGHQTARIYHTHWRPAIIPMNFVPAI